MGRKPLIVRVLQRYWRLTRGMTLGVSACVIDNDNHIQLARSADGNGWQLLCGGVHAGETSQGALRRVLRDEFGLEVTGKSQLLQITSNEAISDAHYVVHFLVKDWRVIPMRAGIETVRFPLDDLPAVSSVTRARIESAVKDRASAETC